MDRDLTPAELSQPRRAAWALPPAAALRRDHARSGWLDNVWWLAALPLLLLITIPLLILFSRSAPQAVLENLRQPFVVQALAISLRTTLLSLALILLLGAPLAYGLARRQFRFKRLLDTLIDLPTVLPPSVAGIALLLTFGRRGPFGPWLDSLGIQLPFSLAAVVIVQVFIAAPFFVRAATLGFAAINPEYIQAAQIDGANRWQVVRYVTLPLARNALISGAVMSWARALGEFGATIIFAGNFPRRTQTMPLAIYLGFERDLDAAVTLAIILVLASFTALLLARLLIAHEPE